MVLVLDHLVKDDGSGPLQFQPQREAVTKDPDLVLSHRQRSDSSASDHSTTSVLSKSNLDSVASEKSLGSTYRARLDSGASDRSQSSSQRGRLDSGASEQSVTSQSYIRQRMGSDVSDSGVRHRLGSGASDSVGLLSRKRTDSGTSDQSVSMSSEERGPAEEVEVAMSSSTDSTDSETESRSHGPASLQPLSNQDHIIDQEQPDGAVLSRRDPANGLLNGTTKGKIDSQKQKVEYTVLVSVECLLSLSLEYTNGDKLNEETLIEECRNIINAASKQATLNGIHPFSRVTETCRVYGRERSQLNSNNDTVFIITAPLEWGVELQPQSHALTVQALPFFLSISLSLTRNPDTAFFSDTQVTSASINTPC